ncbi:hypothetical protein L596_025899 [Steinernema carpocapsae]|uniref:F-box domain-containing protein n=1 Tax=Steinernema carpocapsae TaxID=34508 RepID=A0A4U5M976_STECR|nr:hypothetical protein L596_025899 [Steinernema carpocapsae]
MTPLHLVSVRRAGAVWPVLFFELPCTPAGPSFSDVPPNIHPLFGDHFDHLPVIYQQFSRGPPPITLHSVVPAAPTGRYLRSLRVVAIALCLKVLSFRSPWSNPTTTIPGTAKPSLQSREDHHERLLTLSECEIRQRLHHGESTEDAQRTESLPPDTNGVAQGHTAEPGTLMGFLGAISSCWGFLKLLKRGSQDKVGQPTFNSLSDKVLLQILESLDRETLLEVRKLSQRFEDLANKTLIKLNVFPVEVEMKSCVDKIYDSHEEFEKTHSQEVEELVDFIPEFVVVEALVLGTVDDDRIVDAAKLLESNLANALYHAELMLLGGKFIAVELVDFIPEFVVVEALVLGTVDDDRIVDAAKLLESNLADALYHAELMLLGGKLSKNSLRLLKALKTKPLEHLDFEWSVFKDTPKDDSPALNACLAMFKAVKESEESYARISGPFSLAEVFTSLSQVGYVNINVHDRVVCGGLQAIQVFIEELKACPRYIEWEICVEDYYEEEWAVVVGFLKGAYEFKACNDDEGEEDVDAEGQDEAREFRINAEAKDDEWDRIGCEDCQEEGYEDEESDEESFEEDHEEDCEEDQQLQEEDEGELEIDVKKGDEMWTIFVGFYSSDHLLMISCGPKE